LASGRDRKCSDVFLQTWHGSYNFFVTVARKHTQLLGVVLDGCRVRISTQAWLSCAKLCFRSLVLWPAVFNVLKARWKQLESFDSRKQLKTEDIDSQETDPGPTLVRLQNVKVSEKLWRGSL